MRTLHSIRTALQLALVLTVLLAGGAAAQQSYSYDAGGRLTRVDYDDGSSIDYAYDPSGNLLTQTTNQPPPGGGGGGGGGGGCFIATAAYGSMLDPHVQSLRDFRDEYMLTNAPGRLMIDVYEHTSPPIADVIARYPALRYLTRLALTPIVMTAGHPRAALLLVLALVLWSWRRRTTRVRAL